MSLTGTLYIQIRVAKPVGPEGKFAGYRLVTVHKDGGVTEAQAREVFERFKDVNPNILPVEMVAYLSYDRIRL